jgi:hypothetical protein
MIACMEMRLRPARLRPARRAAAEQHEQAASAARKAGYGDDE